jgi:hypothetical protein
MISFQTAVQTAQNAINDYKKEFETKVETDISDAINLAAKAGLFECEVSSCQYNIPKHLISLFVSVMRRKLRGFKVKLHSADPSEYIWSISWKE